MMTNYPNEKPILTVGIVSDTHVPDRVNALHPQVLPILREIGVKLILHAGDVSGAGVLEELGKIAPVRAVRGNRDWVYLRRLPMQEELDVAGVEIALTHGYGSMWSYIKDKWRYMQEGYDFERYKQNLTERFPKAQIIIFGHTHRSENCWYNEKLIFNPGSASFGFRRSLKPSMGLVRIFTGGRFSTEIVELNGARRIKREWVIGTGSS